ncbi:hypothetical protein K7432_000260 [Basidiobolus ranarum]|uniref:Uncharacterized protein n=1 Tax=Basidiobolus ranarum TaxID=34480 RepID=A0ABR2X4V5_9FUNG
MRITTIISVAIFSLRFVYESEALPMSNLSVQQSADTELASPSLQNQPLDPLYLESNDFDTTSLLKSKMTHEYEPRDSLYSPETGLVQRLLIMFKGLRDTYYHCNGLVCSHIKHDGESVVRDEIVSVDSKITESSNTNEPLSLSPVEHKSIFKRFWNMRYYCGGWVCMHA